MNRTTFLYTRLIIVMLIWGSMGLFVTMLDLSSPMIALDRIGLGALVILGIILCKKEKWDFSAIKKNLLWLFLGGAGMALSTVLIYESLDYLPLSISILIFYTGPVVVVLLSPFLVKEKLTVVKVTGVIVALLGVFLVNGTGSLHASMMPGIICIILAVGMYVLTVVCNKRIAGISKLQLTFTEMLSGVVVLLPFVLLMQNGPLQIEGAQDILILIILGVVHGGLLYYVYFASLQQMSAQSVVLIGYLEPFSALILSAVFLEERLTALQILGAALLLGGAAFGNVGDTLLQKKKHKQKEIEG